MCGRLGPASVSVVERLNREVRALLRDAEVRAQFDKQAVIVEETTPQELQALFEGVDRTWAQFARDHRLAQQ